MDVKIEDSWKLCLSEEFEKGYFKELVRFVKDQYKKHTVYPPGKHIFNAFNRCTFDNLKVVIIGQDPYHGPDQAHGLCFSVQDELAFPPSLLNIFKELKNDMGIEIPKSGNLERWADQGVLLLNATLTVRSHQAGSHQNKGWEQFTDTVIQKIASEKENIAFLLWGAYAQKKASFVDEKKHMILESVHPSPLSASRGFFGNHHFSKINTYLEENGKTRIQW